MQTHAAPLISAILAMDENRVIGKDNKLPWHLPADLKHFKEITTGNPILMGRKTYESIGKPLPERTNIIITRDVNYAVAGCIVVTSLDHALQTAAAEGNKEIFIIGGAEVYKQLLPRINRIYLTLIHHTFQGDTYFPELNPKEWMEIEKVTHQPDEKNPFSYSFIQLDRIIA